MIDYVGHFFPGIITLSGKTYIVPGWKEVASDTKISDINFIHSTGEKKKALTYIEHAVIGSTGKTYIIREFGDARLECSCPGFEFYKKCKHIKNYKNE